MGFLQRILGFFRGGGSGSSTSSRPSGRSLPIYVLSRRCNEPIAGFVDLYNELSESDEDDAPLYARKGLHTSGSRRCFDQVTVHLYFDSNKKLLSQEVEGGRWLDEAEYQREVERMRVEDAERAAAKETAVTGTVNDAVNDGAVNADTASDSGAQRV